MSTLHLPRPVILAALLVVVVGSGLPAGQRVRAGGAAREAAGAAWTILTLDDSATTAVQTAHRPQG